jgi:hypothetical protein
VCLGGRVVPPPSFWAFCPWFLGLLGGAGWRGGGVLLLRSNCHFFDSDFFERFTLGGGLILHRDWALDWARTHSGVLLSFRISLSANRASSDPALSFSRISCLRGRGTWTLLDSQATGLTWQGLTTGFLKTNRARNRTVVLPPLAVSCLVGVADLLSRNHEPRRLLDAERARRSHELEVLSGDWASG